MEQYRSLYAGYGRNMSQSHIAQGSRSHGHSERKLKRRESDAKCRANINAGFDVLKKQVCSSEELEKVSKEMILQESFIRIKYLEGLLVALHQTRDKKKGKAETVPYTQPSHQLMAIRQHFVAAQQRKSAGSSAKATEDLYIQMVPRDAKIAIKRLSNRRRARRKPPKKSSPPTRKKPLRSPIIHLPPVLYTPSRPQKRIKLASTDPSQDQVVPFSPILGAGRKRVPPPALTPNREGDTHASRGAQRVPASQELPVPGGGARGSDYGLPITKRGSDDIAPASPLIDVCTTPSKHDMIGGRPLLLNTPMKTFQIIGCSITPVKLENPMKCREELRSPNTVVRVISSPDLVCNEETTSLPEDDKDISSCGSGGSMGDSSVGGPWFSTPVRPTSLLVGSQPPALTLKHRPRGRINKKTPGKESMAEGTDIRRKRLFRESTEDSHQDPAHVQRETGTPRKKYQKRATAARVRAWDPVSGRVLSPVQPYSGIFKAKQRSAVRESYKKQAGVNDPDFCLTGYLRRKLPKPLVSQSQRPLRTTAASWTNQGSEDRLQELGCCSEVREEADESLIIDPVDSESSESWSPGGDPLGLDLCLPLDRSSPSSPACLKDVSLPPPTGTISPPLAPPRQAARGGGGAGSDTYLSPELFALSRASWRRASKGPEPELWEDTTEAEDYSHDNSEAGFYDYHNHDANALGCGPDDCRVVQEIALEEHLFQAALGDVTPLDPALRPPSSYLYSSDSIPPALHDQAPQTQPEKLSAGGEFPSSAGGGFPSSAGGGFPSSAGIGGFPSSREVEGNLGGSDGEGVITPALASFATSALQVKQGRGGRRREARRKGSIRLNLPHVAADEEEDLNIWKFAHAALGEKDVLKLLPAEDSYSILTNSL